MQILKLILTLVLLPWIAATWLWDVVGFPIEVMLGFSAFAVLLVFAGMGTGLI